MLQEKGLKNSTINDRVMKPLCMALFRAYKRGFISKYPCDEIKRLAEEIPDIDPFSFDELIIFLNAIKEKKPEFYEMIFIWSRTGLRPGEMYALKWRNIDYFNSKILVRQTRLSSGLDGPPKTEYSNRDIDMRPEVAVAFKKQEARTLLQDGYVFLTHANKPFSDAFMRKKFRLLTKLAGMKYRSPKQMRHTFATLHIAAGENITWVSKILGHSSVEITLKKYNRFVPNLKSPWDHQIKIKGLSITIIPFFVYKISCPRSSPHRVFKKIQIIFDS
jgi:integrase